MNQYDEQRLRCYMKDCGCSFEQTEEYLRLASSGGIRDQMIFMKQQRKRIMDKLHAAARQVDCIDYVIHELEQEEKNNG